MNYGLCADLTKAAPGNADPAEQLTPLGSARGQLVEQLATASALPQTWLVQQYIAEARRRLKALA